MLNVWGLSRRWEYPETCTRVSGFVRRTCPFERSGVAPSWVRKRQRTPFFHTASERRRKKSLRSSYTGLYPQNGVIYPDPRSAADLLSWVSVGAKGNADQTLAGPLWEGRGTARVELAQGTSSQNHVSSSIPVYGKQHASQQFCHDTS